ncbi:hypothetical protein CCUS01_07558 [Colletotrichum cuscutae]|uniref:G domain-containing protein n=1 Tax=Colletotrichum cuscutae TaxID=1209917 RepID=A0AAI9XZ40_9PEZI|nr:hypothetical protein CCUS01_07558 [Colletotrichum cuscutae]
MGSSDPKNDAMPDDILLIAVMGVTGAGKSNFLRHLTNAANFEGAGPVVGKSLESCTQKTETFTVDYRERRFVFFDTPGFDDTHRGDGDILVDIAQTLSISYKKKLKLSGIIYLHRIKDERVTNEIKRNFDMFRYLCGDNFFGNVFLVTTFWDELPDIATGEERERQLLKKPDWWGEMTSKGSQIRRFNNTQESAVDILWEASGLPPVVLQVQKEMVDQGLDVVKTTAGVALNHELADLRTKFEEEIRDLHKQQERARLEQDETLRKILEKNEEDKKALVRDLMNEEAALRAENREGQRRQEQEFTDQMIRMEREKKALHERVQSLEKKSQSEQDAAKRRMDEVMEKFNSALAEMNESKAGAAKIAQMEKEKMEVEATGQAWKVEMERLTAEMKNLQEQQKHASASERAYFDSRLLALQSQQSSNTSSFWDKLSSLTLLTDFFLSLLDWD